MGYDPPKKSWVMAYRRLMGYPPYPNSGRAKKYGVPGIMGYQDLWVKGTSTVHLLHLLTYLLTYPLSTASVPADVQAM